MHSALPKMLHPLAGSPLVTHVLAAARMSQPAAIALVVGHGGDAVQAALAGDDLRFVRQDPPRGTGDAGRSTRFRTTASPSSLTVTAR